ncbi:MAG TPA: ABC transporter permease [Halanaerobiales bacterium]|nr:ABC transporter permease [Halanaerobiales bacterium]
MFKSASTVKNNNYIDNKLGIKRSDFKPAILIWIGAFVALCVMPIIAPGSFSWSYVANLLRQASPLGIAALGQMLVLLVAGIDMSIGSVITATNILLTSILGGSTDKLFLAIVIVYVVGIIVGLSNGFFVSYFKVPPIVVTLATGALIEGTYLIGTEGAPRGLIPRAFRGIGEGWSGPFPNAWILWMLIAIILWIVLYRTAFGKKLYATGGNKKAAFASGMNVKMLTIAAYVLSSILAVTAGIIISSYIGVASLAVGEEYTLNSLSAAVLGGTMFTGGQGGVIGVIGGAIFFFVLQSILVNLQIGQGGRWIVQGIVLIIMIIIAAYQTGREEG